MNNEIIINMSLLKATEKKRNPCFTDRQPFQVGLIGWVFFFRVRNSARIHSTTDCDTKLRESKWILIKYFSLSYKVINGKNPWILAIFHWENINAFLHLGTEFLDLFFFSFFFFLWCKMTPPPKKKQ